MSDPINPTGRAGQSVNTPYVDESSKQVSVDNFLQLMIAQLKNQDFTNPVDDTQYVSQLAQFATMQQMQELAYYSKVNHVMGLVGKQVTAASLGFGGKTNITNGVVEKVALSNKDFLVYVDGKPFNLNQIMEVKDPGSIGSEELKDVPKMAVVLKSVTATTADVRWDPVSDDETIQKGMMYSVYYTKDNSFDTISQVKKGTLVGTQDATGILSQKITGLEPNTTYYVNVVVKTPGGKEEIHQKLTFTTKAA